MVSQALKDISANNTGAMTKGFKVPPFGLLNIQTSGMPELELTSSGYLLP